MSLQDDLLTLDKVDRRVKRAIDERNWEDLKTAVTEYESLLKSIRIHLLDQSVASVEDAHAVEILRKITTGDGLQTKLQEKFSEEELDKLGSDLFYSWISHIEYVTGLAELRPLIVRSSVGESVSRLVLQVKDSYALQQYGAAYSLCRTVIEASIRDICVRCKLFPNLKANEILFEEITWKKLRNEVSSGFLQEQLKSIYDELSTVVHGRKKVSKDEARLAFEKTLHVVEKLYLAHGL
jgi:hypothetical protein